MEAGTLPELLTALAAMLTAASGAASHLFSKKGKSKAGGPSSGLVVMWIVCAVALLVVAIGGLYEKLRPCGERLIQTFHKSQYEALSPASVSLSRLGAVPVDEPAKTVYMERLKSVIITLEHTHQALMVGVEATTGLFPAQESEFKKLSSAGELLEKVIKQLKDFEANPGSGELRISAFQELGKVLEMIRPKD